MFMRIPCSFSDTVKSATWFEEGTNPSHQEARRLLAGLLGSITAAAHSTYTSTDDLPVRASRKLPSSSRTARKQRTVRTSYISAPQFLKGGERFPQWYASRQAHHAVWIDGYFRGDPQSGEVSGPVVLVGTAGKKTCG